MGRKDRTLVIAILLFTLIMRTSCSIAIVLICVAYTFSSDAYVIGGDKRTTITDTTKLGTLTVPKVGVGTLAWDSQPELTELVTTANVKGGAFFDTGERYGSHLKTAFGLGWGETECLLRKLLYNQDETSAVVATKFTPSPWRTTAQSVVDACEESRKRLGVESIDLYQIQMPDIVKPLRSFGFDKAYDAKYWDGLAECYHRGLVKNVGVSNYGPTLVSECHEALRNRDVPLVSNQIAFSLIGRNNGAQETLDRCNELGVKVLAYYPFAMGLLTGKYTSDSAELSAEDALAISLSSSRRSKLETLDLQRYAKGDGKIVPKGGVAPLLPVMERIAQKRDKTVAQVALNYIMSKGAIPIPGARTAAQLEDNMGSLGWRLFQDELAQMEYEADNLGFQFEGAGFKRTSEKFVGYGMERWSLS